MGQPSSRAKHGDPGSKARNQVCQPSFTRRRCIPRFFQRDDDMLDFFSCEDLSALSRKGALARSRSDAFQSCYENSFFGTGAKSELFHSFAPARFVEQGVCSPEQQSLLREARGNKVMMTKAYESLKSQSMADPENITLKLACAEALVSMMRIAGSANALVCQFKEGSKATPIIATSDTPDNQAYWSEMAPLAQELLKDVEQYLGGEEFSQQASLFALALETLMYATSAKGVVKAALTGYAPMFLLKVARFEKLHPEWDGAQYCIYRGAYFLAAPWPAYNARKGHEFFELAIKKVPSSRRNQYFAAVGRFAIGDFRGAREAMETCLRTPSTSSSELDIQEFLGEEATRVIDMLKARGY